MLRNVFLKTLRDMRGQVLGWGLTIAIPTTAMILGFPLIQSTLDVEELFKFLPEPIRKLAGDPSALTGLAGFLKLKLLDSYLPILLCIFAILQGAGAVAGEQERGTIDLLMAQPVKRWRVLLEKFAALAAAIGIVCAMISTGMAAACLITDAEADLGWLILAVFNSMPLVLVFGAIALLGSCVFRRARHAAMLAAVLFIWSFFLTLLIPLAEALRPWGKLSLFHYYTESLPLNQGLQAGPVAVLLVLLLMLVAAALFAFERKELTV